MVQFHKQNEFIMLMKNSVDPDQLASPESALFYKWVQNIEKSYAHSALISSNMVSSRRFWVV